MTVQMISHDSLFFKVLLLFFFIATTLPIDGFVVYCFSHVDVSM